MTTMPHDLPADISVDWFHDQLDRLVPTLEGWCSPSKARRLFDLVVAEKPTLSVELGVFGARSLFPIACGHWALHHGYVVGLDPYTSDAALAGKNDTENDKWWSELASSGKLDIIMEGARTFMERVVPGPFWRIHLNSSLEYIDHLKNVGAILHDAYVAGVGFLHQDSNHSEKVSNAEFDLWKPYMAPGALWVMDDAKWASLQKVQARMADAGFTLEEDHEDWRVWRVPR